LTRFGGSFLFQCRSSVIPAAFAVCIVARIGHNARVTRAHQRGVARMFGFNRFALKSPEGDETGGGASGGGSSDDDSGKSKDDVVPKSQFLAAIRSANDKYAALEAQLNELKAAAAAPKQVDQPKEYTRAELNALVESGQINQAQADAQIELQVRSAAKSEARQEALHVVTEAQRKERVTSEIARYTALVPELKNKGSETFAKVAGEFQYLVGLGDSKTLETELKAIRAALGPVETLEQARKGRTSHESHQEHGAGGGGGAGPKGGQGNLKLSEKERSHYQRGIDAGRYKDWKEVEAELQHANRSTRQKHGAPA
jgi:hypothetical protein